MTDALDNHVGASTKCALITPYPNRHLTELFHAASQLGGWGVDIYYYRELPANRKQLGWAVPKHYRRIPRGVGWACWPRQLRNYDQVVFLGIADPPVLQILSAARAVCSKQRVIIATEGRKPVGNLHGLKKLRHHCTESAYRVALRAVNHTNVSLLAIGDRSADDYWALGLNRVSYFRFGFSERSPAPPIPPAQQEGLTILSVGQLIPRKNHIAVLRALTTYQGDQKVNYVICGAGSEEASLKSEASKLPSNCRLTLAGSCSESKLANWLSVADIFVMPSKYDGWGVALNHAIQAGLPAVVSRYTRAGAGHLVLNGVNGFVYDSDAELRDRLFRLMNDPALREQMSRESEKIASLWSFDEIARRLDRFIRHDLVATDDGGPLARLVF